METALRHIQVTLPEAQHRALKIYAAESDQTISGILRNLIDSAVPATHSSSVSSTPRVAGFFDRTAHE